MNASAWTLIALCVGCSTPSERVEGEPLRREPVDAVGSPGPIAGPWDEVPRSVFVSPVEAADAPWHPVVWRLPARWYPVVPQFSETSEAGEPSPCGLSHGRPEIVSLPEEPIEAWSPFTVRYRLDSEADPIARALLVQPGFLSGGEDFGQRCVELEIECLEPGSPPSITLEAPVGQEMVPPGSWMFLVVSRAGIPSEARWVEVRQSETVRGTILR